MVIDGDDISDDIITLGTCLHSRSFPLRADWRKYDSSVHGEPQVEFKSQRRSCKLSFLFPPRRQSVPASLLAGFMKSSGLLLSNLRETTHCTKDTLLLKPRDNTLSLKTSIEKKGGRRSYDTIKVDALILRQKSKPVFSWYVDVNDQWFLVRNSDFFIKAKYCHLLF